MNVDVDALGQALNLIASGLVVLLIIVFWIIVPKNFWNHWVTKWSFILFSAPWLGFLITYFVFLLIEDRGNLWFVLPVLDIGSLCAFLFAVVFVSGDKAGMGFWRRNWQWLVLALFILFVFTLMYGLSSRVKGEPYELLYLLVAIAPSELIANIGTIAMGWAFVLRYRSLAAYAFLGLSLLYAFAQMPGYAEMFVLGPKAKTIDETSAHLEEIRLFLNGPSWIFPFFLAPMKVLKGVVGLCLLYTPFWLAGDWKKPDQEIEEAPLWPTGEPIVLPRGVRRTLVLAVSAVWALIGGIVGALIQKALGLFGD